MKLILLPGLDGTGKLFQPLINELPSNIEHQIISYPENDCLSLKDLEAYVIERLPKTENFILLAESFSGPIGYLIAKRNLDNMKGIFFVATFLQNPNKTLLILNKLLPFSVLLKLPIPNLIIKQIFFSKDTENHVISLFKETIKNLNSNVISFRLNEISKLSLELDKIEIQSFYIQALNDKLVTRNCLSSFTDISDSLKMLRIAGPHFILQTQPQQCAEFIASEIRLIKNQ